MKAKDCLMKLFTLAIAVVAVAVICTAWPTRRVLAVQDVGNMPPPFGLAQGQTVRLNVLNSGEARGYVINWKFLDSEGGVLARSAEQEIIPTDQFRSFDISADSLETARDHFGRIQMRAVVTLLGGPDTRNLQLSFEVFDNATGQSTILYTNPSNDK
jgi:hypothetical protein